jgi:hypothetical protein
MTDNNNDSHFPSMCIPRVFENIRERDIRKVFDNLNLGQIDRIDIINRTTDRCENYKRVFIHFKRWYNNDEASFARQRLIEGKDIKVVYDRPWFWKISASRWNKDNV